MEENNLPPGFRFHPTDEELITYYLTQKVSDTTFTSKAIVDVDLNKCEPWDLPVVKKPQQAPSSLPSLESPCDTNSIVNEFGDIDQLPNLNSIANLSSGFSNNIPTQSYSCTDNSVNMNMNLNMSNWAAAREANTLTSLSWPSSLLSPNLSMNSLLLKALQLRNYQAREATSSDNSFLAGQGLGFSRFENDHLSSNFIQASSSSKVLDSVPVAQSQPEQPYNMDSIW
ncbi:hypothetical protein EZV62_023975 [Acer yangbiense]|uniref:NAC domain-containing protein n=1 Tax=Acer yangbiense TaxID=1000413 RepID=A0A5C7H3G1_9ROSI|nr:hypothetical protein EZV62_023975 [Acer yangbiense]